MRVEPGTASVSQSSESHAAGSPATGAESRTCVDSRSLLQGSRELIIRHAGQEYRLRHTQNDKLILTK